MTRQEFIIALRKELKKLPPEEIVAATEFYEEYFDEVLSTGRVTEEEIIKEMGSPKRLAAQIKADYATRILDNDVASGMESKQGAGKQKGTSKISAVWWVIIGICSAPVSIPLAIVLILAAICLISSALGIFVSIYSTIIGIGFGGLFLIGMALASFSSSVASGIMFLGAGLALAAVAAAAGFGAFIGTRALVKLIIKELRAGRETRKNNKLNEMAQQAGCEWVPNGYEKDPRDAFKKERGE